MGSGSNNAENVVNCKSFKQESENEHKKLFIACKVQPYDFCHAVRFDRLFFRTATNRLHFRKAMVEIIDPYFIMHGVCPQCCDGIQQVAG